MAEEHLRRRVFFVVDYERDGYSVFKLNLKDLFSDDHHTSPPPATKMKMEMLPLTGPPVASFREPEFFRGHIAFAVSGTTIVGLGLRRTFTYEIKAQAAGSGPGTAATKYGAFLLPVGADDVYALSIFPQWGGRRDRPHLEALSPGKGITPAWRALPEPPPELQISSNPGSGRICRMTACFTMGGRLWLSAQGLGTYSLETAGPRRTWRKEGSWELPVEGLPAVYVPELGRLFGFCPRRRCLCACDMDVRPPVVKEVWEETWPGECIKIGYGVSPDGSLVYLGGGRLCITRLVNDKVASSALCVQAVQLQLRQQKQHRVEMVMRRIRCYTMPKIARRAYALQPSTS